MENINQVPSPERFAQGPVAIFECIQRIPCNPCADACPRGAITVKEINDCPMVDLERCNGCGLCMTHCPGLSIFVIDSTYGKDTALIKIPYEFSPLPQTNEWVDALDRQGVCVGNGQVVRVQQSPNKTSIIWLAIPQNLTMDVRNLRLRKENHHE